MQSKHHQRCKGIPRHTLLFPWTDRTLCLYPSETRGILTSTLPFPQVAIHLLAGAARSAYQTVLVNSPPEEVKTSLKALLADFKTFESAILD